MDNKKSKFKVILIGAVFLGAVFLFLGHEKPERSEEEIAESENPPRIETKSNVERYGVFSKNSTSGDARFYYYDMETDEVLDEWQGYPWFFAATEEIENREKTIDFYNYINTNKNSVFKITGTKIKDDCEYFGDGRCLESIIVEKIEVAKSYGEEDSKVSGNESSDIAQTEEDLERYYSAYNDPFVLHVRKALNGYLDGTNEGMDMPEVVIEESDEDGTVRGLSAFDKSYYESKFIVTYIVDALFGGKNIGLLFQDKPDRAFTAWVYKTSGEDERYDLRGFWEDPEMTKNLDFYLEEYDELVFDKEHSL